MQRVNKRIRNKPRAAHLGGRQLGAQAGHNVVSLRDAVAVGVQLGERAARAGQPALHMARLRAFADPHVRAQEQVDSALNSASVTVQRQRRGARKPASTLRACPHGRRARMTGFGKQNRAVVSSASGLGGAGCMHSHWLEHEFQAVSRVVFALSHIPRSVQPRGAPAAHASQSGSRPADS